MLNNLNSSENADAVENIGDHTDFGIHAPLPEGKQTNLFLFYL